MKPKNFWKQTIALVMTGTMLIGGLGGADQMSVDAADTKSGVEANQKEPKNFKLNLFKYNTSNNVVLNNQNVQTEQPEVNKENVANQETRSTETVNPETQAQENAEQEATEQETLNQETTEQEVANQEVQNQEVETTNAQNAATDAAVSQQNSYYASRGELKFTTPETAEADIYNIETAGIVQNLVSTTIGNDNNLFSAKDCKYYANDLFTSNPATNKSYKDVSLLFDVDAEGYYVFDSDKTNVTYDAKTNSLLRTEQTKGQNEAKFMPLGQEESHFGMNMETPFYLTSNGKVAAPDGTETDGILDLTSDDDTWVYVDNKLVLDLGGIHSAVNGRIDFTTGDVEITSLTGQNPIQDGCAAPYVAMQNDQKAVYNIYNMYGEDSLTNLNDGNAHTLKIYSLERSVGMSDFKLKFNMPQEKINEEALKSEQNEENLDDSKMLLKTNNPETTGQTDNIETKTYKTAEINDVDNREYKINISASSIDNVTTSTDEGTDIMLVLDVSTSMENRDVNVVSADDSAEAYNQLQRLDTAYKYDDVSMTADGEERTGTVVFENDKWVFKSGEEKSVDITASNCPTSIKITRIDNLRRAVTAFIKTMREKSPNSRIGIVAISDENGIVACGRNIYTLTSLDSDTNMMNLINAINGITMQRGSCMTRTLADVYDLLITNNPNKKRAVILFSDCEEYPDNYQKRSRYKDYRKKALALKDQADVYGISYDGMNNSGNVDDPTSRLTGETYLKRYADEIEAVGDVSNLANGFNNITQHLSTKTLRGDVIDYIDPRFTLVKSSSDSSYTAYEVGDTIPSPISGEKDGKVFEDSKGIYIKWENQPLEVDEAGKPVWNVELLVRANDDFLGGNVIPTNGVDSRVDVKDENSNIVDTQHFPRPLVNVQTKSLSLQGENRTVFFGNSVEPCKSILGEELYQKIIKDENKDENGNYVYTEPYSYKDTQDYVGDIVYTIKIEKGTLGNHIPTGIGSEVEKYEVSAKIQPIPLDERIIKFNATADSVEGDVANDNTSKVSSIINVVAGKIVINKTIPKKDYEAKKGDPIFTFKITRKDGDEKQTFNKTLRFTKKVVDNADKNTVTLSTTITNLPKGNYRVEELDSMGFKFESLGYSTVPNSDYFNVETNGKVATFKLGAKKTAYSYQKKDIVETVTTEYKNTKIDNNRPRHDDVVKNIFNFDEESKADSTNDADNGVESNYEKLFSGIFSKNDSTVVQK